MGDGYLLKCSHCSSSDQKVMYAMAVTAYTKLSFLFKDTLSFC